MSKKEPTMGRADVIVPSNQELVHRLMDDVRSLEARVTKLEGLFATTKLVKTMEW